MGNAGPLSIALSGGSTPGPVYEALGATAALPWSQLNVFFADERAVPPDDPESNFRLARDTLLVRAPLSGDRVHRMPVDRTDLEVAADEYADRLPARLDLVVLGVGADGHTASLFPHDKALEEQHRRVVPVVGPQPPHHRLTVTPPVLEEARQLVVLATGRTKAETVQRALYGDYDPRACPAQLARRGVWILDESASGELLFTP